MSCTGASLLFVAGKLDLQCYVIIFCKFYNILSLKSGSGSVGSLVVISYVRMYCDWYKLRAGYRIARVSYNQGTLKDNTR